MDTTNNYWLLVELRNWGPHSIPGWVSIWSLWQHNLPSQSLKTREYKLIRKLSGRHDKVPGVYLLTSLVGDIVVLRLMLHKPGYVLLTIGHFGGIFYTFGSFLDGDLTMWCPRQHTNILKKHLHVFLCLIPLAYLIGSLQRTIIWYRDTLPISKSYTATSKANYISIKLLCFECRKGKLAL